jgi:UDP-N-acetylglucosamine--N-acetylmuramyl-(pentapeptide) pyrophosphoryl-undecaprenol N-acetylglucosamine transferase
MVREAYASAGSEFARVVPFIDDMPTALAQADLVIGRSGASAVSEITAVGRPSLLVPYPYASGNHQFYNARALEAAGAAVCLPSDVGEEDSKQAILELLSRPARLVAMAQAARGFGRPHAALHVARDFLELLADGSAVPPHRSPPSAAADHGETLRFAEVA